MAKQISQEMFDDVVKENMEDFDMEVGEAIEDAVKQFEAQGVNLANIVKEMSLYTSGEGGDNKHPVVTSIDNLLEEINRDSADTTKVIAALQEIKKECDIDIAHQILAGKNRAYLTLVSTCQKYRSDPQTLKAALEAFCSLCKGQPDLLEGQAAGLFIDLLKASEDNARLCALIVRLIKLTCVMHEANRQMFVDKGLIPLLTTNLDKHRTDQQVVKEACSGLKVLTLDDDIRVPFGKGHEHAKMIVTEENALKKILNICQDFANDKAVMAEVFSTLSKLAVRNEFCQEIVDFGGLKLMLGALEKNMSHLGITKQALGVLKVVAGNDNVKVDIVTSGGLDLTLAAMMKHQLQPGIQDVGCALLAVLALRTPEHCRILVESGAPEIIVKAIQLHPDKSAVQKNACMAIRNIVARTREYKKPFLDLGAEQLIGLAVEQHKDDRDCQDQVKAALRDLECKVHLNCPWTGQGGGIQNDIPMYN